MQLLHCQNCQIAVLILISRILKEQKAFQLILQMNASMIFAMNIRRLWIL